MVKHKKDFGPISSTAVDLFGFVLSTANNNFSNHYKASFIQLEHNGGYDDGTKLSQDNDNETKKN